MNIILYYISSTLLIHLLCNLGRCLAWVFIHPVRTSSIWKGFMYKLLFIIDVICVSLSNKDSEIKLKIKLISSSAQLLIMKGINIY